MNQQLLYVSTATEAMQESDLKKIEATSLVWNSLNSVTGVLCFDGEGFMQLLEGEGTRIDRLVEKLKADHRHTNMDIRYRKPVEHKCYGDWAIRIIRMGDEGNAVGEVNRMLAPTLNDELVDLLKRFARGEVRPSV